MSFAAEHYTERASDYVTSAVHANGADLDHMEAAVRSRPGARVLDLGCGGGHVTYRAAPHAAEVVACDVTQTMLDAVVATASERGLSNVMVQRAAAEALPFEAGRFDIVLCRYTAHHWTDLDAGLREARRVLAAGGVAVFVDTVAPEDPVLDSHVQAMELLRDPSHVRNYTVAHWVAALARARLATGGIVVRKVRMEFAAWVARTRTPALHADAIRSLQRGAPRVVRSHFAIGEDGGFDLDVMTVDAG